ncbi:hypothetical protein LguiB_019290 [Lonicera macranthoides]
MRVIKKEVMTKNLALMFPQKFWKRKTDVGLNRVGFVSLNELDWIEIIRDTDNQRKMSEPPKYAYPYPAQGYYQGPPVMAPPQYYAAPPPRREPNMKPQSYQPRSLPFEGEFLLYSLDKSIDSSQKFSV